MVSISVITGTLRNFSDHDNVYLVNDTNYTLNVLLNVASLFISTSSCMMTEHCKKHSSTTVQF